MGKVTNEEAAEFIDAHKAELAAKPTDGDQEIIRQAWFARMRALQCLPDILAKLCVDSLDDDLKIRIPARRDYLAYTNRAIEEFMVHIKQNSLNDVLESSSPEELDLIQDQLKAIRKSRAGKK